MLQNDECKGCKGNVRLSEEEIKQIFGDTMKIKDVKVVTEEVYAARLSLCGSCDALQYGTTCKFCGCLVQVKAKLAGAKCPYPYAPRW